MMSNCAVVDMNRGLWSVGLSVPEIDDTASAASSVFVATSRMSGTVSASVRKLSIAWNLNSLSRKLCALLDGLYASIEKAENGAEVRPTVTKEQIESAIKTYEYLYDVVTRLYTMAHEHRLTNNSMMAGSLATINRRSEELLDIADWLHAALHSSASSLDAIYAQARKDLAEGKVYDIAATR